jgi:hypothetical protein
MTKSQLERKITREREWRRVYAAQGNHVAVSESERRLAELLKMLGGR